LAVDRRARRLHSGARSADGAAQRPDTYLHIAAGRWTLAHAALPVHDPFSHSLAGATWVPHE